MLRDQYVDENSLKEEKEIIIAETKCLLDKCFELGNGDIALGTVRAFQAGVLDIPFAPSRYNAGQMLPVREDVYKRQLLRKLFALFAALQKIKKK